MNIHIDFAVNKDCLNPYESYGEICVRCNCCGRIDEKTKMQAQLETYKRHLQDQYEFDNWLEGFEEIQRANIQKDIEYYTGKISEVEQIIAKAKGVDVGDAT